MARAISESVMNKSKDDARKAILKNTQKLTEDDLLLYLSLYATEDEYNDFVNKLINGKFMSAKKYFLASHFSDRKEVERNANRIKKIEAVAKKYNPNTYNYKAKSNNKTE